MALGVKVNTMPSEFPTMIVPPPGRASIVPPNDCVPTNVISVPPPTPSRTLPLRFVIDTRSAVEYTSPLTIRF